ncbi:hypothetical protein ACWA7J_12800 [Leptothrix sp. BB-4]
MPLTVRLDPALERALEVYCATQGVSKSLVVQESLASYLVKAGVAGAGPATRTRAAATALPPSDHWLAFEKAGLIGCIGQDLGGASGPADKAAVRAQVKSRARRPA